MTKSALRLTMLSLVLMLLQVTVFNHMCLFNIAVPLVFVMGLFKLPVSARGNCVMVIGFLLGLLDDVFADTYGMNALACTVAAFVRRPVLKLYIPRDEELVNPVPSCHSMGFVAFAKYLLTMTLIYCVTIFCIEAFTFFNPLLLIIRIVASTALSFAIMYAIDVSMTRRKSEKRL